MVTYLRELCFCDVTAHVLHNRRPPPLSRVPQTRLRTIETKAEPVTMAKLYMLQKD